MFTNPLKIKFFFTNSNKMSTSPESPSYLLDETSVPSHVVDSSVSAKTGAIESVINVPDNEKRRVGSLSAKSYNLVFYGGPEGEPKGFIQRSLEYPEMILGTREVIDTLPKPPKNVLVIGAGDGGFDRDVFGTMTLESYVGLEPNQHHLEKLRAMADAQENWSQTEIFPGIFNEDFDLGRLGEARSFDIITMPHCVYFMQNPAKAISHAQRLLSPNGKIVTHHQSSHTGCCPFFVHFKKELGIAFSPDDFGHQNHGMGTDEIVTALDGVGIPSETFERSAGLVVTDFLEPDAETNLGVRNLLSFIMNTEIDQFNPEIINQMIQWVRNHAEEQEVNGDREVVFPHPQGFVIVSAPGKP